MPNFTLNGCQLKSHPIAQSTSPDHMSNYRSVLLLLQRHMYRVLHESRTYLLYRVHIDISLNMQGGA